MYKYMSKGDPGSNIIGTMKIIYETNDKSVLINANYDINTPSDGLQKVVSENVDCFLIEFGLNSEGQEPGSNCQSTITLQDLIANKIKTYIPSGQGSENSLKITIKIKYKNITITIIIDI